MCAFPSACRIGQARVRSWANRAETHLPARGQALPSLQLLRRRQSPACLVRALVHALVHDAAFLPRTARIQSFVRPDAACPSVIRPTPQAPKARTTSTTPLLTLGRRSLGGTAYQAQDPPTVHCTFITAAVTAPISRPLTLLSSLSPSLSPSPPLKPRDVSCSQTSGAIDYRLRMPHTPF